MDSSKRFGTSATFKNDITPVGDINYNDQYAEHGNDHQMNDPVAAQYIGGEENGIENFKGNEEYVHDSNNGFQDHHTENGDQDVEYYESQEFPDNRYSSQQIGQQDHSQVRSQQIGQQDHSQVRSQQIGQQDHSQVHSQQIGSQDHSQVHSQQIGSQDHSQVHSQQNEISVKKETMRSRNVSEKELMESVFSSMPDTDNDIYRFDEHGNVVDLDAKKSRNVFSSSSNQNAATNVIDIHASFFDNLGKNDKTAKSIATKLSQIKSNEIGIQGNKRSKRKAVADFFKKWRK